MANCRIWAGIYFHIDCLSIAASLHGLVQSCLPAQRRAGYTLAPMDYLTWTWKLISIAECQLKSIYSGLLETCSPDLDIKLHMIYLYQRLPLTEFYLDL